MEDKCKDCLCKICADYGCVGCKECDGKVDNCAGYREKRIKDSGERREFETGAVRDMQQGKGRYDLLPWVAIDRLAKHVEQGAIKYGERNCEQGIPTSSLADSALRHMSKYMRGYKDEDHLVAAFWNLAYLLYMEEEKPEMQNIPTRLENRKEEK